MTLATTAGPHVASSTPGDVDHRWITLKVELVCRKTLLRARAAATRRLPWREARMHGPAGSVAPHTPFGPGSPSSPIRVHISL
jgi:hypothetical protein